MLTLDTDLVRRATREVVVRLVGSPVGDSDPLISSGLIDSLSILVLVTRLEQALNVRLPSEGIQPDDFETIDVIVETVSRVASSK